MTLERTLLAPALLGLAPIAARGSSPRRSVEIVVGFAAGYSGSNIL